MAGVLLPTSEDVHVFDSLADADQTGAMKNTFYVALAGCAAAAVLLLASGCASLPTPGSSTDLPSHAERTLRKWQSHYVRLLRSAPDLLAVERLQNEAHEQLYTQPDLPVAPTTSASCREAWEHLLQEAALARSRIVIRETVVVTNSAGALSVQVQTVRRAVCQLDEYLDALPASHPQRPSLGEQRNGFWRFVVQGQLRLDMEDVARAYDEARDPETAQVAYEHARQLIEQALSETIWSKTERADLRSGANQMQAMAEATKALRTAIEHGIREEVTHQQKLWVNQAAVGDVGAASQELQHQQQKHFNWRILGYPRDNSEALFISVQRCERVTGDARPDYILRNKAGMIRGAIWQRFGDQERQSCRSLPAMPAYDVLSGFPKLSDEQIKCMVAERWLQKKPGQQQEELRDAPLPQGQLVLTKGGSQ
jgi:tetratricopeptide (TPR) repeat protein